VVGSTAAKGWAHRSRTVQGPWIALSPILARAAALPLSPTVGALPVRAGLLISLSSPLGGHALSGITYGSPTTFTMAGTMVGTTQRS
jgi:hypothetical protein